MRVAPLVPRRAARAVRDLSNDHMVGVRVLPAIGIHFPRSQDVASAKVADIESLHPFPALRDASISALRNASDAHSLYTTAGLGVERITRVQPVPFLVCR